MKRLISTIVTMLMFIIGTAFNAPIDSTQILLKKDTTTVANINVTFDKLQVEQKSVNLEQQFQRQLLIDQSLVEEINELNSKIPDMNVSDHQTYLTTLEKEMGITKEDYNSAVTKNVRLTNSVNLIIFILGLGIVSYLLGSKQVKRGPDVVLKLSTGVLFVLTLFMIRTSMLVLVTFLFNPTYQIINQFIHLGG